MHASALPLTRTARRPWAGFILSGISVLFLLMDAGMKLVTPAPAPVVEGMAKLGWNSQLAPVLGVILLICTLLYAIPRTAVIGAILLTGYLGGAIATHVRAGSDLFSIFFSLAFAVLFWGGLWLRDGRVKELIFRQP